MAGNLNSLDAISLDKFKIKKFVKFLKKWNVELILLFYFKFDIFIASFIDLSEMNFWYFSLIFKFKNKFCPKTCSFDLQQKIFMNFQFKLVHSTVACKIYCVFCIFAMICRIWPLLIFCQILMINLSNFEKCQAKITK